MALVRTAGPSVEPITLDDAKAQTRNDLDNEDALILAQIAAAREYAETTTERALITQTWRYSLDRFPAVIRLPMSPVQQVTEIKYIDALGVQQTLSTSMYRADTDTDPARITPAYNEVWPVTHPVTNAVEITYVAGYGDSASDVPQSIRQAMLMLLAHWDENRSGVNVGNIVNTMPYAVDALLMPYKLWMY